jgi:hypothetical protein
MPKNPNNISSKCPECGSTVKPLEGTLKCTQDKLNLYDEEFRKWKIAGEGYVKKQLQACGSIIREMYDRWDYLDDKGNRPSFQCFYEPVKDFNPMTEAKVYLPDPIQQKIAETILGRTLTEEEYRGEHRVPLINQNGEPTYDRIQQLVYPYDFISLKDMTDKTDYTKMPVVFQLKTLKKDYEAEVNSVKKTSN